MWSFPIPLARSSRAGLHRTSGHHDDIGTQIEAHGVAGRVRHDRHTRVAAPVLDLDRLGVVEHVAVARRGGPRQERLWLPFLASTGQACPTHCGQRTHAGRPSWGSRRVPAVRVPNPSRAVPRRRPAAPRRLRTEGRQRVAGGSRRPRDEVTFAAGDTELQLRTGIAGLHVSVGDRPVGQARALRVAVDRGHPEVLRQESPSHSLPQSGHPHRVRVQAVERRRRPRRGRGRPGAVRRAGDRPPARQSPVHGVALSTQVITAQYGVG